MDKKTKALELALECAANYIDALGGDSRKYRQALAERPAQQQCKFPLCQNEEYQQALAEQIKRDLYTGPPASKPMTDEEILRLVPGLYDCLCDPYDCDNSGDYYASIPKDMIRLARAIEAYHSIKEKNT